MTNSVVVCFGSSSAASACAASQNPTSYLDQVLWAPLFFNAIAPFLTPQDLGRFVQVSKDAKAAVVTDDGRVRVASLTLVFKGLLDVELGEGVPGPLRTIFSVPSSLILATRLDFSHLSVLRVTIEGYLGHAEALSSFVDSLLAALRRISSSGAATLDILTIDTSNILDFVPAIQGLGRQDRFDELLVKPLAQLMCVNFPNLRALGLPVDIAVYPISDVPLAGGRLEKLSLFGPLGGAVNNDIWRTVGLGKIATNSLVFRMVAARTSNIVTLNLVQCMHEMHDGAEPSEAFWAFMQHVLPGVTNFTVDFMELDARGIASEGMERLISMCHGVEVLGLAIDTDFIPARILEKWSQVPRRILWFPNLDGGVQRGGARASAWAKLLCGLKVSELVFGPAVIALTPCMVGVLLGMLEDGESTLSRTLSAENRILLLSKLRETAQVHDGDDDDDDTEGWVIGEWGHIVGRKYPPGDLFSHEIEE